jgi:hypothetical protein
MGIILKVSSPRDLRILDTPLQLKQAIVFIFFLSSMQSITQNISNILYTVLLYSTVDVGYVFNRTSGTFLGAFAKSRKATISFIMSVRASAWNNSASSGIFVISEYFSKRCREN